MIAYSLLKKAFAIQVFYFIRFLWLLNVIVALLFLVFHPPNSIRISLKVFFDFFVVAKFMRDLRKLYRILALE